MDFVSHLHIRTSETRPAILAAPGGSDMDLERTIRGNGNLRGATVIELGCVDNRRTASPGFKVTRFTTRLPTAIHYI